MESWADQQPKVNSLSDVVEVAQTRGAEREVRGRRPVSNRRQTHTSTDCLRAVTSSLLLTAIVIERMADTVRDYGVVNTVEGRILAEHVAELVNAVLERSAAVVPTEACPGITRQCRRLNDCVLFVTHGLESDWISALLTCRL